MKANMILWLLTNGWIALMSTRVEGAAAVPLCIAMASINTALIFVGHGDTR